MEVIVVTLGGMELKIELDSSDTLKELKEKIHQQYQEIPVSSQKLIFKKRTLDVYDSVYLCDFLHQGARLQLHQIPITPQDYLLDNQTLNPPPSPPTTTSQDNLLDDQNIQRRPLSASSHHQDRHDHIDRLRHQYCRNNSRPIPPLSQDHPAPSSSLAAAAIRVLFARNPYKIQVKTKIPTLRMIEPFLLTMDKRDTTGKLKEKIRQVIDLQYRLTAKSEFKLIFFRNILHDNGDKALKDFGFYDRSEVIVMMMPPLPQYCSTADSASSSLSSE